MWRSIAVAAAAALVWAPGGAGEGRDDTAFLQAKLDAGGTLNLPKLPNGDCYATRGLWVSRDDTTITSNGACIVALGPGEVRLTSPDGDAIAANAVFFVNHSAPLEPTPVRIAISGVKISVPASTAMFGIAVYGHEVTVRGVTVSGSPVDAVTIGGRANGSGYAGRVAVVDSTFSGAMRNVVSATGVISLRLERNRIFGARDLPPGQPAAGIDLEPDHRGAPTLDVSIARNTIVDNAGPGIIVSLDSNRGLPVIASQVRIDRNKVLRNGRKPTPPQLAGIVLNGGQDRGGARLVLTNNVVRGNRGPGVLGNKLSVVVVARGNDLRGNTGGPSKGVRFSRR
jgi:Right handed beta helix region